MDGITEGRIVHYVLSENAYDDEASLIRKGDHVPAMVTRVLNPIQEGKEVVIHLSAFLPGRTETLACRHVGFDDVDKAPGTWHWIERA